MEHSNMASESVHAAGNKARIWVTWVSDGE